jgi:hypothetical protein
VGAFSDNTPPCIHSFVHSFTERSVGDPHCGGCLSDNSNSRFCWGVAPTAKINSDAVQSFKTAETCSSLMDWIGRAVRERVELAEGEMRV